MTVLERCQDVSLRIQKRGDLRRGYKQAEALGNRAGELTGIRGDLTRERDRTMVLSAKGFIINRLPNPSAALSALGMYKQKLAVPGSDPGKEYGLFKRAISKFQKDLMTATDAVVQGVLADLPEIDEPFLRVVELIPGYKIKVDNIRRARGVLHDKVQLATRSADHLQEFLDHRDALRKLIDELNPPGFPKEVLDFFRATRQPGGAPFEKLTDGVKEWLRKQDMLKYVRVTITPR